ncbi:MAG: hypothetical protein ACRD8W_05885 [Nitrososphaeraceae archaeon]
MAKPRKFLKKLLMMLNEGAITYQEIRKSSDVSRKTVWKNIRKARQLGFIDQDEIGKYFLTDWGKTNLGSVERPVDSFQIEVPSQIIGRLRTKHMRPTAEFTIVMNGAKKIKKLDDETVDIERFLTSDGSGLIENNTYLKAAAEVIIDTILDLKAKDIGLKTILDHDFREVRSPFNQETIFPTYDYLKRYEQLAATTFKVLIEFDGGKWIQSQNFSEIEGEIEAHRQDRKEIYQYIRSMDLSKRVNKVICALGATNILSERSLEALRLFQTRDQLKEFIYNCFKLYSRIENEEKLRIIVSKALELGYIKYETRKFKHLKLNKSKKAEFLEYLWQLERRDDSFQEANLTTTDLRDDTEDNHVNNRYENHEVMIKEVVAEIEMFENSFLNLIIKLKDRFDKAQYYDLYKERELSVATCKTHLANVQLYADSLQEVLRLFHSKLLLYLLRSIIFWPRRIHNKRVLNKLNSVVFSKITEACNLLREALTFEAGDEFNGYLDAHILRKIDVTTDLFNYAKQMSDPIIEKECQSILNSITHVYTECQDLSYPEPPDIPGYSQFKYK